MKSFEQLYEQLLATADARPENSRTVQLLEAGVHAIGKKIVEEAAEVWMAGEYQTNEQTAEEISQLIYHLQVLMVSKGISISDIEKYL